MNKIEGLENATRDWIVDKAGIHGIVVRYFMELFAEKVLIGFDDLHMNFPIIDTCRLGNLNCEVLHVEITDNLFAIGRLKTPGPDSLPVAFFQHVWDLCRKDVSEFVKDCFAFGCLPEGLNHTYISLILKIDKPLRMTHLRPINLCNTLYKVISKILVERLCPLMPNLVGPT